MAGQAGIDDLQLGRDHGRIGRMAFQYLWLRSTCKQPAAELHPTPKVDNLSQRTFWLWSNQTNRLI
jgi:hypothetical protein